MLYLRVRALQVHMCAAHIYTARRQLISSRCTLVSLPLTRSNIPTVNALAVAGVWPTRLHEARERGQEEPHRPGRAHWYVAIIPHIVRMIAGLHCPLRLHTQSECTPAGAFTLKLQQAR